jgi:hypothetical protein
MATKVERRSRKRLRVDKTIVLLSTGLVTMEGMLSPQELRDEIGARAVAYEYKGRVIKKIVL